MIKISNKKRRFGYFCFGMLVLITIMGVALSSKLGTREIFVTAKTDQFTSEEELRDASELIVTGKKINSEAPVVIRDEKDEIVMVYTLSSFKIESIIKGETDEKTITVLENVAYDEVTDANYHINGYTLMEDGKGYKLYLSKATDGSSRYIPVGVNAGKKSI